MKKARKNAIIIFGISLFTAFILLGSVLYITRYTVRSKEGTYEAVLQAVGDPAWPFGSAPGRLVLKKDGRTLSKTDIEIANDGGRINDGNWKAAWRDDRVEITLSGQEQYDELVKMYYGGQVVSLRHSMARRWKVHTIMLKNSRRSLRQRESFSRERSR